MKKLLLFLTVVIMSFTVSIAQEIVSTVAYQEGTPIYDRDLDGLTDEGEVQLYKTDMYNPDTDGDGIFDGVEVVNGTDPLRSELSLLNNEEEEKTLCLVHYSSEWHYLPT